MNAFIKQESISKVKALNLQEENSQFFEWLALRVTDIDAGKKMPRKTQLKREKTKLCSVDHGFLYNWIGKLFLPSAWLGHSLIFYNFKTIHLKLIKFDENMVLWLVNQNFEKNQVLMYHFSSNACLRKLNLNLREKKSWFSNACNFLRKTFSNLLKHELYFN